jgi:hypothetical protein
MCLPVERPWPDREGLTLWRLGFVVERWDPPLPVDGSGHSWNHGEQPPHRIAPLPFA